MASTSASSRTIRYRTAPEVNVREIPELECCLVYSPSRAELYTLNPLAWFVFRACEGRSESEIAAAYAATMTALVSSGDAARQVHETLRSLEEMGIVQPQRRR